MLALELIVNQKGTLTISKHPNLLLKIRKGNPVGCKIVLKKYLMINFISRSLNEIFPNLKDFDGIKINFKTKTNSFSFLIQDSLHFSKLNEHYYLFNNLSSLNLSFVTTAQTKKEMLFLLKSLQLPFIKNLKSRHNSIGRV